MELGARIASIGALVRAVYASTSHQCTLPMAIALCARKLKPAGMGRALKAPGSKVPDGHPMRFLE